MYGGAGGAAICGNVTAGRGPCSGSSSAGWFGPHPLLLWAFGHLPSSGMLRPIFRDVYSKGEHLEMQKKTHRLSLF